MKLRPLFCTISAAYLSFAAMADSPNLPTTEILGKQYFYHDVEKGESIYGIARKYDWNLEELVRLNPSAATHLKKGTRLYYPTGMITAVVKQTEDTVLPPPDPIKHTVKKGETVYSIAKKYDIPVDVIYASHPSSRHGIKAGETIVIEQSNPNSSTGFVFYEIKTGDTLFSLAKRYHTTIEDILDANTGLSENHFRSGDIIRISPNSDIARMRTELVEEERVAQIDTYKVKKNDTWQSIARKTGVQEETLKEVNEADSEPEKNELITVPIIEKIQVQQEVILQDPRELSEDGVKEIYDSIHGVESNQDILSEVKVALILDEPNGKKDIDFLRGFLLQLDQMQSYPFKINLKVIDGHQLSELTENLEVFKPNLIVSTADKTFSASLSDYGLKNKTEIINVFDVKNELFEENPSIVQLLPPSSLFNDLVSEGLASKYRNANWLSIGANDDNDAIFNGINSRMEGVSIPVVSYHRLNERNFKVGETYVLYVSSQRKEEVQNILNEIETLAADYPGSSFVVVGRPNWVTFSESFRDKYVGGDIEIPARCWFDSESMEGKAFADKFSSAFGQPPVKSFPNFAASGYDVASYFINLTANTGGDYNLSTTVPKEGIQTYFDIERTSNWGGFLNPISYLLTFHPSGSMEKSILR